MTCQDEVADMIGIHVGPSITAMAWCDWIMHTRACHPSKLKWYS